MITPTSRDPPQEVPRREVLVVDDVPEILDFFRGLVRRLRGVDARLTIEVNGQRALEAVARRPFDLVLSDFRMRQVDGVEVLRAARRCHPQGRRVLMTGYNEVPAPLDLVMDARVDAYVQKPLRGQDLLGLLDGLLRDAPHVLEESRRHARALEEAALREARPLVIG